MKAVVIEQTVRCSDDSGDEVMIELNKYSSVTSAVNHSLRSKLPAS